VISLLSQYEHIADGLATGGYAIVDDFLSLSEVNSILATEEFGNALDQFRKAGTGQDRQINATIRGDYIQWLDRRSASHEVTVYLKKLEGLLVFLNRALFLSLKDFEIHKTVYPSGAHYERHLDQFREHDHRRLSIICYLNVGWEERDGGQLRLFLPAGPFDIYPQAGRLVCFRSNALEHEVLPATRNRLSITGWILDQLVELRHLS